MSDDAADAGSDGQRHSDLRLHISRDRDSDPRHVDDGAAAGGAVGEGQNRKRTRRDDAMLLPGIADAAILLPLFHPSELACELLPRGRGHFEVEQEAAVDDVADEAIELAEIAEIGRDGIADLADHGHGDHHPEWRYAAGPARKGARPPLRVKPVCKGVMPANRDVDGRLTEKLFDGHGSIPRGAAATR